jgi:hypothetical protein
MIVESSNFIIAVLRGGSLSLLSRSGKPRIRGMRSVNAATGKFPIMDLNYDIGWICRGWNDSVGTDDLIQLIGSKVITGKKLTT